MFTLVDNTYPQRIPTLRIEYALAPVDQKIEEDSNVLICHDNCRCAHPLMEHFAEGPWFAGLRNSTCAGIERLSSASPAREMDANEMTTDSNFRCSR